jgi:hypothetical protein
MVGTHCCASTVNPARTRSTASLPDQVLYAQPNFFTAPLRKGGNMFGVARRSFKNSLMS